MVSIKIVLILSVKITKILCFGGIRLDDAELWTFSDSIYGNITLHTKIGCREDKVNVLEWLRYNNYNRCIYLVSDYPLPVCLYNQMRRNNLTCMTRSTEYILQRDVIKKTPRLLFCNSFMIFTKNLNFLANLFDPVIKHFLPFTNFFLFTPEELTIPHELISNALYHGYNMYSIENNFFAKNLTYFDLSYHRLINLYTNETLDTVEVRYEKLANYFGNVLTHPLFNKSIVKQRPFRISTFNCPPYVIVDPITQQ